MVDEDPTPAADQLYPLENYLKDTFRVSQPAVADRFGYSLAEQAQERQQFVAEMRQAGLAGHPQIAQAIYAGWAQARLHETEIGDAPSDAEMASNAVLRRADREIYGEQDSEDLQQRTVKYLGQIPALARQVRLIFATPDIADDRKLALWRELTDHVRRSNFR